MTARPLLNDDVKPAEAVALALLDAGIDTVFGIPGSWTVPIFAALGRHRDAIRTVLVREEARAGVMAEVHSRLTGRPAVCMGQGAFMTHASIGLIEALQSSTAMLLLSELADSSPYEFHGAQASGTGAYGSWDARAVFGGLTKEVFVANTPVEAVHAVQLAVQHAVAATPGPVAVLFHSRALRGRIGPESRPRLWSMQHREVGVSRLPSAALTQRAAGMLAAAERPAIVAGNGVRIARAYAELTAFAHGVGAPVATTAGGKGCFPETDDLALGVLGNFGTPLANAVVGEADVVLVVGSRLSPSDTAFHSEELLDPARQTIIQVDVDPRNANVGLPAQLTILGDAKTAMRELREALGPVAPERLAEARSQLARHRAELGHFDFAEMSSSARPILPQRVVAELQQALDDDAIVCCDAGENRLFMMHYFQTSGAGGYLQSSGVGAMGYAMPAALAARLAEPERQVVAVCGDGGFSIGLNSLMTSREEDLPVIVVVMNNQSLGWVRHGIGDTPIACDFGDFDFAAVARALGCDGIAVSDPDELAPVIRDALKSGRTTVVDVRTSLDETFEKVTSPLVGRALRSREHT
jgi:acetolactate synthase-1/2/3 large subunit